MPLLWYSSGIKEFFMAKFFIAISVLFLSSVAICGEIYTWTDEKGVKRFTNTPVTSLSNSKIVKSIGQEINYTAPSPEYQPSSTTDSSEPSRETKKYLEIELPETLQTKEKPAPEASPYKVEWSTPRVSGDELSVSGSVSNGEACKLLTVTAFLFDEKGNEKFIRCQASDVGGSVSRILNGKIRINSSYYGSDWRISSHSTRCSR
jgi:hypothetical protein